MSRLGPGDWMCGACQHLNFKKRDACQRCGYSKVGGHVGEPFTNHCNNRTEVLVGDWYCSTMNCSAHNYASRTSCFRCGAIKGACVGAYSAHHQMMASGGFGCDTGMTPGWKAGDWICNKPGCGMHNYASRIECYKCKVPRDFGHAM